MDSKDVRLRRIWQQGSIPVIFRQGAGKPTLVRLPYSEDNRRWVRDDNRRRPHWNSEWRCWETPATWFDDLIERSVERYGKVYVIQLYREQQKCAPACWNAVGYHCECSCMGENHGSGDPGGRWHEVSETFAFSWGPKKYACRLITSVGPRPQRR